MGVNLPSCTQVVGHHGLPVPKGFSSSAVWNRRYVEALTKGIPWSPDMVRVCGVVYGWPSKEGVIAATRSEHVLAFLKGLP